MTASTSEHSTDSGVSPKKVKSRHNSRRSETTDAEKQALVEGSSDSDTGSESHKLDLVLSTNGCENPGQMEDNNLEEGDLGERGRYHAVIPNTGRESCNNAAHERDAKWYTEIVINSKPDLSQVYLNSEESNNSSPDGSEKQLYKKKPVVMDTGSVNNHHHKINKISKIQAFLTLMILLMANLLNYVDRSTIAGVLGDIQDCFKINNSEAGLLQTSFICSYMILSPIFGYLGDRWNRKYIMAGGIFFWSVVTLAGSFVPGEYFWVFVLLRGLVGVGEASYSTIAPTIIADLFAGSQRTIALAIFYFAIPVGSGLGYIVGSNVAHALHSWRYALRVTPGLGLLCVLAIIFVVKEPTRGAAEGSMHIGKTSWLADLKYLCKNKSFVFSSLGFTCVAFVAGAMSLWTPMFLQYSIRVQGNFEPEQVVALKFGIITCLAGFLGVGSGTFAAGQLRKISPRADPLVCAFGLIAAAPFLYFALFLSKYNTMVTWIMIFIGETFVCLNWAIVTDIVLYIVIPTRRSTAEAFQILFSHALGDAGSPYLVGAVSDAIRPSYADRGEAASQFISLQYSMYMTFVCVIGGGFFFITALYIAKDRARAQKIIKGAIGVQEADAGLSVPTTAEQSLTTTPEEGLPNGAVMA